MLEILHSIAGHTEDQSTLANAFGTWESLSRQATSQRQPEDSTGKLTTTQRWEIITKRLQQIIIEYSRPESGGNLVLPNVIVVEKQYELLINMIDENLAESIALMEAVYPGIQFRPEGTQQTVDVAKLLPDIISLYNVKD